MSSGKTRIEWTDKVWNPITGCTPTSLGCENCYAKSMSNRLKGRFGYPSDDPFRVTCHRDRLFKPFLWSKPQLVFANSMSDFFHNEVPLIFLQQVIGVMSKTPHLSYQVLTKRSERLVELAPQLDWPDNLWMGVTVEAADYIHRIDNLKRTPAKVKFLSIEPLLSPIGELYLEGIDWVIAGGESGLGARPMDEAWVIEIRDQCLAAGVPFFFKQWGGASKKQNGRTLEGRTWDEFPKVYTATM